MSGRNSILRGEIIELTAIFLDAAGDPTDPTNLTVSVYPPGSNPETGAPLAAAWVYGVTLSDGGLGPEADPAKTVTKTSVGHYKYTFTVPADAALGSAFDRWEAVVDFEDLDAVFNFVIVGGGSVGTTKLYENNAVFVSLDADVSALDGSTLGEEVITYFTTTYNPLYSEVKRVRLDIGPLISDIADDTINLAIYEASLAANANTFSLIKDPAYFKYVRREYTTCLTELTLTRALSGDASIFGTMRKQLADLSVSRGASPQLMRNIDELMKCVEKWDRVMQTGGDKTPYTSIRPGYSVKGAASEDAMTTSRQWSPTSSLGRPAGNAKVGYTSRKGLKTHRSKYDPYSSNSGYDEDFE